MTAPGQYTLTFAFEEVMETALDYFLGDKMAANTWMNNAALKDASGRFCERSPEDTIRRFARELARAEKNYPKPLSSSDIYGLTGNFRHLVPSFNLMYKIGNPSWEGLLSEGFVISQQEHDYSGNLIIKAQEELSFLMRNMGKAGMDLSFVPPLHQPTGKGILLSQGLVSALKRMNDLYDDYNSPLCKGKPGFSIRLSHPDLPNFIDAYRKHEIIPWAEIAVVISDKDMKAEGLVDLVANWIHKDAMPVIVFEDNMLRDSISHGYSPSGFHASSYVPRRSLALSPHESSRHLYLNLYDYVDQPFTGRAKFNTDKFTDHVHCAVRLADDLVDLEIDRIERILQSIQADKKNQEVRIREKYLLERLKDKLMRGRRAAIGVTGYADMLAALNIRYGAEKSFETTASVFRLLAVEAFRASTDLASERGAFPIFDAGAESENAFIRRLGETDPALLQRMMKQGRRNISLLSTGPCNELYRLTGTSLGLQPVFLPFYLRRKKMEPSSPADERDFIDEEGNRWKEAFELHPGFKHYLLRQGLDEETIASFSQEQLNEHFARSPYFNSTQSDIDNVRQIQLLSNLEKLTDQSIRLTLTMKHDSSTGDITGLIRTAHHWGIKLLEIYREGFYMYNLPVADQKN